MSDASALVEAKAVIRYLTAIVKTFVSPDGRHRALRSPYSRKGCCEVYQGGQHSPLCLEMFAVLQIADDWWREHGEVEEPQQIDLFDALEAVR